jgi:hypothetical protein
MTWLSGASTVRFELSLVCLRKGRGGIGVQGRRTVHGRKRGTFGSTVLPVLVVLVRVRRCSSSAWLETSLGELDHQGAPAFHVMILDPQIFIFPQHHSRQPLHHQHPLSHHAHRHQHQFDPARRHTYQHHPMRRHTRDNSRTPGKRAMTQS